MVPEPIRPNFVDFLCKLGITHCDNLHHVLNAIVLQFIPAPPQKSEDCQQEIYQRAHRCLKMFIESFPLYVLLKLISRSLHRKPAFRNFIANPLLAACRKNFPNIQYCDPERFHSYVCNMVSLVHGIGDERLAESLWTVIMERVFY